MRTLTILAGALVLLPGPALAFEIGLPIDCRMGETCFLQQLPDMDAGAEATDPWCGGATYDGHDGTDIRIIAMPDVETGVPVIASADGTVVGFRDRVPDNLVMTDADREAVADIECGNGVVLDNGDGWETQYCHMRDGSVTVTEGQSITRGDVLGMVGASGLAQFPHVHLSVRKDGKEIDPFSGREVGSSCGMTPGAGPEESLWDVAVIPSLVGQEGSMLALGFAGDPPDYDALVVEGPPPEPTAQSPNFVGYAWFINLQQGDEITLRLEQADGTLVSENTLEPLDRHKAAYSAFVGKKGSPPPGEYTIRAVVIRDRVPAISEERTITIE